MKMQNSLENKNTVKEDDVDHRRTGNTKILSRTTIANFGKTRTNATLKVDHSKDKELINNGLQKLISNFNSVNKIAQKTSKVVGNKTKLPTPAPAAPGNAPIPEKPLNSHIVLNKQVSTNKYTMTDFKENKDRKVGLESTVLGDPEHSCQGKDLQWTDPRLLKKYSLLKQPCKKALTIPYVSKSDYGSEKMEDNSDDDSPEIVCSEDKKFFFKCLYYMCTASVSFIGSMCGITLITLILWKVLDENILPFKLMESPKHDLFFKRHITSLVGSVIYLLNTVFGKLSRLLTMSASEVFAREEESPAWYRNYIKY